jgi:CheY-like chemotaxis protein
MSSKLLAAALLTASAAFGSLATPLASAEIQKDANFAGNEQARDLLAEGVKEFRTGRYKAAAAAFASALSLNPDNQLVYQWYLAAGDSLVVQMAEYDELSDVLKDVLRKARIYQRELRHDPKYIDLLMGKLVTSDEERAVAILELVAIGPVAVPQLLAKLGDNRQDESRAFCRIALHKMGYRSVIPLLEATKGQDLRQVTSAVGILGDIGDPRALPRLVAMSGSKSLDSTTQGEVQKAIASITAKADITALGSAEQLYFNEAQRYFRAGSVVSDEMVANESLCWRWVESEADPIKKLAWVTVPRHAWNELIAEQLVFDGLAVNAGFAPYQPLLAAILAAEVVEVEARLAASAESTVPAQAGDEQPAAIADRVAKLREQILRVRMAGSHLYGATTEAIDGGRGDVAALILRQLQDRRLARADLSLPTAEAAAASADSVKPGSVLVAALNSTEKIVRYQAAITLAHLDPALAFAGAEAVPVILAQAVGEWGARVVLVIEPDFRFRNHARRELQEKGYTGVTAADGFEAIQLLEESPVKDVIIVDGTLAGNLRDEQGQVIDVPEQKAASLVDQLKADPRVAKTPILVSLPEDPAQADAVQKAFDGKVAGFVRKPFGAADIDGQIQLALQGAEVPNVNRDAAEDISRRACLALQQPDPSRTQFALAGAAEALVKTLDVRGDAVRIEALKALGHIAQGKGADTVRAFVGAITDVYIAQDGDLKPAVRAAFLQAIGLTDPTTKPAQDIITKALTHEDPVVRGAAAEAVGYAIQIQPELIASFQIAQRLDVREAGAVAPAAAPAPVATPVQ